MKKKNNYFVLVTLLILSLTPLIWFWGRGSALINGVDTNFPLDPEVWITRRFYVWNSIVNAGSDFSSSTAGFFFHFIQYIPYKLTGNLQLTEILSLIFWFSSIVLSSFIFAKVVLTKNRLAQIIFVLLYSFNIYLFNAWENVKVANLALVITLPLGLTLISLLVNRQVSKAKISFLSLLVGTLAAGAGINPAYITVLIIAITIWFAVLAFNNRSSFKISDYCWVVLPIILINAYWIVPTIIFILSQISSQNGLSSIGFSNWVDSLSENTSLLNVMRLQGAWDWYAFYDTGAPVYIPYAVNYFNRVPFIVFSFVIPLLAFISFFFFNKKEKALYILFGIFFVIAVFLGAGTHEPTGIIFKFLGNHVPFFSLFRSPWYIFTPLLLIAYAGLVSLLISNIELKFSRHVLLSKRIGTFYTPICFGFLIIFHLLYSYPLITGKIFRPGRADSFYVNFPSYIFEAKDWLTQSDNPIQERILSYPDDQIYTYTWGYRGIESLLGLFSNKNTITPSVNFGNESWDSLLSQFYLHLKRGETYSAKALMPHMGADSILDMHDLVSLAPKINDKSLLSDFNTKSIGPWTFYTLKNPTKNLVYIPNKIYVNYGNPDSYAKIAPVLSSQPLIISAKDSILQQLDTLSYSVLTEGTDISLGAITNKRDYSFDVPRSGEYTLYLEKYGIDHISQALIDGSPITKVSVQNDSLIALGPIYIDRGQHRAEITLPDTDNLITNTIPQSDDIKKLRKNELPEDLQKTYVAYNDTPSKKSSLIYSAQIDPFSNYAFTYDYKYIYGKTASIKINQSIPTSLVKTVGINVGYAADWQGGEIIIDPVKTPSKIEIWAEVDGDDKLKSKTYIENFSLKKIYTNSLVVLEQNETQPSLYSAIDYKQNNPTSYSINTKGTTNPYFLVFLSMYSPAWNLTVQGEQYTTKHITANGFANAWYIPEGSNNHSISINYANQTLYRLGQIISVTSFIIISFGALYSIWQEKRNNSTRLS